MFCCHDHLPHLHFLFLSMVRWNQFESEISERTKAPSVTKPMGKCLSYVPSVTKPMGRNSLAQGEGRPCMGFGGGIKSWSPTRTKSCASRLPRSAYPSVNGLSVLTRFHLRRKSQPARALLVEIGPEGWTPTQQPPEFSPSLRLLLRGYFYNRGEERKCRNT
jgi:hypothetical protein